MNSQEMLSLSDLNDIVIPDVPAWWPPAAGFWVLFAVVALAAAFIGFRSYRRWMRNRYRRAGLLLLEHAATEHEVSVVLKRVALAAYPRDQVASLYGTGWLNFLSQTWPRATFPEGFAGDHSGEASHAVRDAAADWIKHHRTQAKEQGDG